MSLCPSMFSPTLTKGGWLCRLRLMGGRVNSSQIQGILEWLKEGTIEITRRGNLQHRAALPPSKSTLQDLQDLKLIGNPTTDHLRNVMLSPMADLDPHSIDLSFLGKAWEQYLTENPQLAVLSPKFSLGLDGGEKISIRSQLNDILISVIDDHHVILSLVGQTEGISIALSGVFDVLRTITLIYLSFTNNHGGTPRLKELVDTISLTNLWQRIEKKLDRFYERRQIKQSSFISNHLGIHQQILPEYRSIGLAVPAGHLSFIQLQKLKEITERFGRGELRFTPWQSVLIPHIHQSSLSECLEALSGINLSLAQPGVTACAGLACNSSLTDTQSDAQNLMSLLNNNSPSIHLSGCPKLCAYSSPHSLKAIGIKPGVYALYRGQEFLGEYTPSLLTNVKHFL